MGISIMIMTTALSIAIVKPAEKVAAGFILRKKKWFVSGASMQPEGCGYQI
jgi:hypothetical protein